MKYNKVIYIVICLAMIGCRDYVPCNPAPEEANDTFMRLLVEAVDNSYKQIPGVSASIVSSNKAMNWSGVYGFDSKKRDKELTIDQPYRIASVTKTFVATAILRLHEMDSLSIDDSIVQYISEEHNQLLLDDGYDTERITLRHCMHHSSGIFDYAMDSKEYLETIQVDAQRRWTRTDQIKAAMEWGDKLAEPGAAYSYSDTGYILLGEAIEFFYGGDLAKGLRELIGFDKLGMNSTWLEILEPAASNLAQVHRYVGRIESTKIDPSIDLYGGGGLVSTSPDLAKFAHALFNGGVYDRDQTLELMLTKPDLSEDFVSRNRKSHKDYRMGISEIDIYGEKAYMHGGLWGIFLIHIPAYNSSYAFNFTKGFNERLAKKIILVDKNLRDN